MPMNKTVLGTDIANQIMAGDAPDEVKAAIRANWIDIAGVIIEHIKLATITVAAGIPVATVGSASAQSGATTAPGTATIA